MKYIKFVGNIFLSIVLTTLIIISMLLNCTKTLISSENISDFINEANILEVDINTLFNQEESGIILKDKLYSLAIENNIPTLIIEDILNSEQITKFLGDFFNQTIKYIISGKEKPKILNSTINDMKKIANISLENHLNIMLEEEQLNIYIENYCNSIVNIIPDRNSIINDDLITVKQLMNIEITYIYIIIALILVLLSIINKKWYNFIKYLGITLLISGILFVVVGSLEYIIIKVISDQALIMKPFIIPLITNILTILFKNGVITSFSSIVIILVYLMLNKSK